MAGIVSGIVKLFICIEIRFRQKLIVKLYKDVENLKGHYPVYVKEVGKGGLHCIIIERMGRSEWVPV